MLFFALMNATATAAQVVMPQEPHAEPEPNELHVSRGTQTAPLFVEFAVPALRAAGPCRAYVVWHLEESRSQI
eukprot:4059595-Amphidinium_carterae.1